jgi:transcriptional regulator with XRE-family HTH domain
MSFVEDIKILCVKCGNMSQSELARRLGESPQNLYLKLKRNSIKDSDLKQIALALNCKAEIVYKDIETGKEILISNL